MADSVTISANVVDGNIISSNVSESSNILASVTTGAKGDPGAPGAPGAGIIAGGTANQALTKIDSADYNAQWQTIDKTFIGLGNVDNTSDATKNSASATLTNKTISGSSNTITNVPQSAVTNLTSDLAGKEPTVTAGSSSQYYRGDKTWQTLNKAAVGLSDVDNTSDSTKNSAIATLTNKTISGSVNTITNIGNSALTNSAITIAGTSTSLGGSISQDTITGLSSTGLVKRTGTNTLATAVSGIDYLPATVGTDLLRGDGSGGTTAAVPETDYVTPSGTGTLNNKTINAGQFTGVNEFQNGSTIALYNTADQTTNYERIREYFASNVASIRMEAGGTGVYRDFTIGTNTRLLSIINTPDANGIFRFDISTSTASAAGVVIGRAQGGAQSTLTQSSGSFNILSLQSAINQSGTAGYTALLINPTETATGSGAKRLLDLQVGGTTKFNVDNTGIATVAAVGTAAGSLVSVDGAQTLTNKTLTNPHVNTIYDTNGNKSLQLNATASAVNYLYVVNGATGNSISFRANGTDTNISIGMFSKGSGQVQIRSDTNGFILAGDSVASGVNYVGLTNAATGTGPTITSTGSDTNVDLNITAKGTGNLNIPTGTGLSQFNTSDKTTNYERVRHYWSGNIYNIMSEAGGTGTRRVMYMSALFSSTAGLKLNTSTVNGVLEATNTSSTAGAINLKVSGTWTASSGVQYGTTIVPTVNQTSTAGYTALLVNPTETGVGSGSNLLADFQVGGTSKVSIKNDGVIFPVQAATASAPTYVKGGVYFDTTLNKLRVGGASGWETITSI